MTASSKATASIRARPRCSRIWRAISRAARARHDHRAGGAGRHARGVPRGLGAGRPRRPHVDHVTDDLTGFLPDTPTAEPRRLTSLPRPRQTQSLTCPGDIHVHADLAKTIDDAFEKRNDISPRPKARCARRSRPRSTCSTAARRASPSSRRQRRLAGQPVAEEGGAAVVPPQRQWARSPGGAGSVDLVGQGAVQVRRLGRRRASRRPASAPCRAAIVRRSAYIAPNVVLMPSFVNLGAYVDCGTMVDTWATVGSCAQIGKNCHLSGGAGIGGVLEPLQAGPGDHRGQLLHRRALRSGRRRGRARGLGAVDGRLLGASTKIVDRATGEMHAGRSAALFGRRLRHPAGQADEERRSRARASTAP